MSDFFYPPCLDKYIGDQKGTKFQLNAIPFRKNPDGTYNLYFPRPFTIVGFVNLLAATAPGATPPSYPQSFSSLENVATHTANAPAPIYIFLDLAYANCMEFNFSNPINYVGPGKQGKDWRGYFSKILNQSQTNQTEQDFNTLIQPGSLMDMFFTRNGAVASDVWYDRWKAMIEYIELTADPNLFGAPGLYGLTTGNATGSPTWNGQTEYSYQFAA